MPFTLPDANCVHPVTLPDGSRHPGTVFLSAVIDHPRISIGDFSYASDLDPPPPDGWAARLAPYLYPVSEDQLEIGKFCQIAHGVRFITASANHATRGLTTYPFGIFELDKVRMAQPDRRDTRIGHDVWIGQNAMIGPAVRIGNGAIIAAGAVVRRDVPDYAVVAGNPAEIVRMRFGPADIATLNRLGWWDWPPERIAAARPALEAGDIGALEALRP